MLFGNCENEIFDVLNELQEAHPDLALSAPQAGLYWEGIGRREKGEPVAYIRGIKEFFGYAFSEGQRVMLLNSAANRDPRKFPDPLTVDFGRHNIRDHIAFASGPHRCLGAPVARLELRVMLEELLQRIPDFTVIEEGVVEYPRKGGTLGFDKLPGRFTPSLEPAAAAGV